VRAIDRKLVRDLWSLKTQVISIALVIACGIAAFIASISTYQSLLWSRQHYYDTARFPHLFIEAKRAPGWLAKKLAAIAGVSEVEVRVVRDVQLDIPGVDLPMVARTIGLRFDRPPGMNRITLSSGRWPAPGAAGEVLVNQRFAEARKLALGASLRVLLNGKRESLTVVGTALSPEYIYATRGDALPDDEWFAVIWMDAEQLAVAFDMEGAFNSALLRLEHGASADRALAALDRLLAPYGTSGGYLRTDQISNKIVSQEIEQQRVFGTVLPGVFLLVAAFILNVVLQRQVSAQRGEIAALKALGYDNVAIGSHYLKFTAVVVLSGIVSGVLLGDWLGRRMTALYTEVFQFPEFHYLLEPRVVLSGALVALIAAWAGALGAIRGVVRLKPAEALRPPAPQTYRPLLTERLGIARILSPAQRMIFRNLERRPVRAALTVAGIAGSVAILISGVFWRDAVERFIEVQFHWAQPAAIYLGFTEPVSPSAAYDLARMPGVVQVETSRSIGARLRAGYRSYRTSATGIEDGARLLRIVDGELRKVDPPPEAVLLTDRLAKRLGVVAGDTVTVELIEGKRAQAELRVAGTVRELVGMNVWMRLEDLNRIAGEGALVSSAALAVDQAEQAELIAVLNDVPRLAAVMVKSTLLDTFRATSARNLLFFTAVLTAFAVTIAVGVVYNNARIQLAERAWELASLRVLGMTRGEVSVLLLGELALEIAAAIPLGCVLGYGLASLIVGLTHGETFEIPMVILPSTYLYAGAAIVAGGVLSALVVRHQIDRLDLVAVLKTRE
jgi:putative ABC transport system permease protein